MPVPKTAFCTADGLFEFLLMLFGLKGVHLMQQVLEGLCPRRAIPFLCISAAKPTNVVVDKEQNMPYLKERFNFGHMFVRNLS